MLGISRTNEGLSAMLHHATPPPVHLYNSLARSTSDLSDTGEPQGLMTDETHHRSKFRNFGGLSRSAWSCKVKRQCQCVSTDWSILVLSGPVYWLPFWLSESGGVGGVSHKDAHAL